MVYLNNAATSYPKPQSVYDRMTSYYNTFPKELGRSSYSSTNNLIQSTKATIGTLLHIKNWNQIYFTPGATWSANEIIRSLPFNDNSNVIITSYEHNAVLRPLHSLLQPNQIKEIKPSNNNDIDIIELENLIDSNTIAIFVNHCSNVTGTLLNIKEITSVAHRKNTLVIVDISQSAGCVPINIDEWNPDIVFSACHKGLLGIPGLGLLYVKDSCHLYPSFFGGTGENSKILDYRHQKEAFEIGTPNLLAVSCLKEGIDFILKQEKEVYETLTFNTQSISSILQNHPNMNVFGGQTGNTISFTHNKLDIADYSYLLFKNYQIITRAGLQCAPLICDFLGCSNGVIRLSPSFLTTPKDLNTLRIAIDSIEDSLR